MRMKIAVYGTLKKWGFWHSCMENSQAKYISWDYIEVQSLKNIVSHDGSDSWHSYPHIIFRSGTGKFIYVEIYEIGREMLEKYIDPLEEYTGSSSDPYTRKQLKTQSGEEVWVYDSQWESWADLEVFFEKEDAWKRYYNWKGN